MLERSDVERYFTTLVKLRKLHQLIVAKLRT